MIPGVLVRDAIRIKRSAERPGYIFQAQHDVFVFSFSGDDVLALKKEWRERGLLPRFGRSEPTEIKSANGKTASPKSNADDADNAEERREKARWLYNQCSPAGGSVVQ